MDKFRTLFPYISVKKGSFSHIPGCQKGHSFWAKCLHIVNNREYHLPPGVDFSKCITKYSLLFFFCVICHNIFFFSFSWDSVSTLSYSLKAILSSCEQFLPMGDTFIRPLRNSTNVPLYIITTCKH